MAFRHGPSPAEVPTSVKSGRTPARTREFLPDPAGPITRRKGFFALDCRLRASRISPTAFVRPKKIGACSNSNGRNPLYGFEVQLGDPEVFLRVTTSFSSCLERKSLKCARNRLSNS